MTAPCVRLKNLIDALPPTAEVTLALDGARLRVTSGRGRWSLPTLPALDFPVLTPPADAAATFTLPADEAQRLVQRVSFAISQEETRYYLNGAYLHATDGKLCAVATDGHRLSEMVIAVDPGSMPNVILPTKAVDALDQLLRIGDVTMRVAAERVELTAGGHRVITKTIDATYPDYAKVLPAVGDNAVSVDANALLGAVKRLQAVLEIRAKGKAVGLQWGDGSFSICLPHAGDADGCEDIDPISCTGTGRVAVQVHYLVDQIEALDGDTIVMDVNGGCYPLRITRPNEPTTTTILMPLRWDLPAVADEPVRKQARKGR